MKETPKHIPLGHVSYVILGHQTLHSCYFYSLSEIKEFFWKFDFPYNPKLKIKSNFKKLSKTMMEDNKAIIYYGFYD